MKVYVWKDKAYPVYGIDTDSPGRRSDADKVEIPDDLYQRYLKIKDDYAEVQSELEKYSCE